MSDIPTLGDALEANAPAEELANQQHPEHAAEILSQQQTSPIEVTSVEEIPTIATEHVQADAQQELVSLEEQTTASDTASDVAVLHSEQIETTPETTSEKVAIVVPVTEPALAVRLPRVRAASKKRRRVYLALLLVLLLAILVPLIFGLAYGINALSTYNTLKAHASSGAQHLLDVKTLFAGGSTQGHLSNALQSKTLTQASKDFVLAQQDFKQVQYMLDHTQVISLVTQMLPQYRSQVAAAHTASAIGIDAALIGQDLIAAAKQIAPRLQGPLLNNTQTPLLTAADLATITSTMDQVLPLVTHIESLARTFSVNTLPLSAHQRTQVTQLLQLLPQVQSYLQQGRAYIGAFGWLLGVTGGARTFLVQTMDRAELRPTGGFTGQYGELQINAGRIAPFSLRDISLVEYTNNSPTSEKLAPIAYRSWWPFANWGLRDSNLSADFPTSAQIAMQQYNIEVGHSVDGVVLFTPALIQHVLQITGPLKISTYNETITAQNLEERLHYYQLDNVGIVKQQQLQGNDSSTSDRKRFTSLVARTLMDHVRQAPPEELLAIAHEMLYDLQTKDLQVYVDNTQIEHILMQYQDAGQMDTLAAHDGLYVVQANVSASKASQYVSTSMHDVVSLDSTGGATHVLQIRLSYHQIGPVYGLDTYRDYLRVYVPSAARLLWGDGFDTATGLCGGPFAPCASDGVYPGGELVCPVGLYDAGYAAPMLNDPYQGGVHPFDQIGPPSSLQSDVQGRAMFAGYVIVPKNCTMTVMLSWYVPSASWHDPYTLTVQRQAGTYPDLNVTVLPYQPHCVTSSLYFDGLLTQDTTLTARTLPRKATPCASLPAV